MTEPHRCGTVAIVGRPNVGKSSLLNRFAGQKISITSRKPQTTRQRITGIVTLPLAQLVFVDTPGFQVQYRSALTRLMNRNVRSSVDEVDAVLWVVEGLRLDAADQEVGRLLGKGVPLVIAVNKVDRVQRKQELLPFLQKLEEQYRPAAIVPVSATTGHQIPALLDTLAALLPPGERAYSEDEVTTLSERSLAAELVREKLIRSLGDELPYAAAVEIEKFEMDGTMRRIHAAIIVDKESQKGIVIGKGGAKLKQIASAARRDMETLFQGKVFLEIWVRVKSGWADDERALKRMGLDP